MSFRRFSGWQAGGFLVSFFVATSAHALCGDGVWDDDEQCDDGNSVENDACNNQCRLSCETISSALTSHTCGHGEFGPFVDLPAQSYPGFVFMDISTAHTYFTLTMSGDPGENQSAVLYAPTSDAVYAFYLKEPYPFSILSYAGDEVPVLFEHEVSCVGAPKSLTWVKTYELSSSDIYTVVFGPTEGATVSVAVELVGPASPVFWDRDGDYWGGALAGLGACNYDEATVEEPGDCDDSDADTYLGASELCDGTDSDCAGDNDTDAEGLCGEDSAGTACVEAGAATRCGCAVNADCEGEATCNVAEQRCEASAGTGGTDGEGGGAGEPGTTGGTGGEPSDGGSGGTATGGSGGSVSAGGSGGSVSAGGSGGSVSTGGSGGSVSTGGSGSGGTSNGGSGMGGSASTTAGGGGEPKEPGGGDGSDSDGGCGCRMVSAGQPNSGFGLLGALLIGWWRRKHSSS